MASEVTQTQIDALERVLDRVFKEVGIDVEFSRHFVDRVNDERNKKQITVQELALLFKKEFIRWGKQIAQLGPDSQAVMKDLESDINIPFALEWNGSELELVAKTVMRKAGFKTSNQEFPVESTDLREMASAFVGGLRKRAEAITEAMSDEEIDDFHTELDSLVHKHLGHSSDEHAEEMCSDACCGQPVKDCTCGPDCEHCDCYEKNNAVSEGTEGCADCEWIKDETDGDIDTCDECAEELEEAQDCWDGYAPGAQTGVKTKPGTGKNKGKRVNNCEPISK